MYFNGTKYFSLLSCCIVSLSLSAKDAPKVADAQGFRKPLCFIENKGQIADEYNHTRRDIQYKVSTQGMSLYIGNGQLKYQFKKIEGTPKTSLNVTGYEMDVTLLGVNPRAKAISADEQAYHENYYTAAVGPQGVTAHAFNKVIYKNVYRHIDWVLYIKNDKLEYDFIVHPGGNVKDIQLRYDGATALSLTKDGGIAAETPMGNVEEKTPYAYETSTGKAVASKFVLKDNVVSFNTADYKGALTIDPALYWSSYFGGPGEDVATAVQVDASGTYIGGYTAGGVTGASGAIHTLPFTYGGGSYDAFIAKYPTVMLVGITSVAPNYEWVTYYGGAGNDVGTAVALDNPGGSVYLTGYTSSATVGSISSAGAYQGLLAGDYDGFLVKFNSTTGSRTWGTYFGGADTDYCNAVVCDASSNVYIAGQTASAAGITFPGPLGITTALNGTTDAFVAKFNSTGGIQWARYFGGSGFDNANAIACDNTSSLIITGQTNSINGIATTGAYDGTLRGFNDAFVAKFNDLGMLLWGTYYGGPGQDAGNGIACDPSNNIAVTGNTGSTSGIASANAQQPAYGGGPQDAFIALFNSAGTNIWSTYYGGTNPDYGQGICFDAYNNIVVTGGTFSSTGIANINASPQTTVSGSFDAFLTKFTAQGQQIWGTYFGGSLYNYANAVACNTATNQITIAGFTNSDGGGGGLYTSGGIGFGLTPQTTFGGGVYDGFVAEFYKDTFLLINQPFVDTLVCKGGTLNVSFSVYSTGVSYLPGNLFTVQLSNSAGSFASPVAIGTGITSPIACTIPNTPGPGYRIRIVSTSPAFTSPDDFYNISIGAITSLPHPSVAASTPVCLGNTLYLYSSAFYPISNYNWSGPGGYFASLPDPVRLSATYADTGTYTLITAHNGCPPDTTSVYVTVNPTVTPPTPTDSGSVTCSGDTLYLFASNGIAGSKYSWSGPDGFTSTLQNPIIPVATAANSGVYTVVDTVASCQSLPSTITAGILPRVPTSSSITADAGYITGNAGDTVCFGTLVTFTAIPVNGGFSPSYQWMNAATGSPIVGAVAGTYSSSTLLTGETIYCIVTSSLTCPLPATTTTNSITMDVINTPPLVYIGASPAGGIVALDSSVTFTSSVYNGGTAPLYQWVVNNVPVAGATNSTFTISNLTQIDTVSLILTSNMTCATPNTASSNTIVVETNVGVRSLPSTVSNIDIYPNPNNGSFTVKGNMNGANNTTVSLEILSTLGQAVYDGAATVQNGVLNKTVDLQIIPDGIYLLRVNQGNDVKTFRFTVQR